MAEGFAKELLPKDWKVYSAGIRADGMNERAIKVMREAGIDISSQYSKTTDDIKDIRPDIVITLCDNAQESCPVYLAQVRKEHWGLKDPADAKGSEDEIMAVYRKIRNEIQRKILTSRLFYST